MVLNVAIWALNLTLLFNDFGWIEPCNHINEEKTSFDVREVVPGRSSDGLVSVCLRIRQLGFKMERE